jgi:hypothetical protein
MTKPKQPWCCQKCSGMGKIIPRATPRSKICSWCADELRKAGQRWCSNGRHGVAAGAWASSSAAMCRNCQHDRNQAYRQAHIDAALDYSRAYHAAHRDELIANSRAYYQAHRDELLEQKRVYYQERRELIKAKVRAHRPHIPEASREKERNRHRAKHQIYKLNEKLARARRFVQSIRGAPHA